MWFEWKPYVSVAERRRRAERELAKLTKKGRKMAPIAIEGRKIAATFWGESWCANLERYSDFANRLPRGRSYVRNGAVLDLQIAPSRVEALVSGTEIYRVAITVAALPKARWKAICGDCAGGIDSLVELLRGRFSDAVMERICREKVGLFPAPTEIELACSCPDWASMCKHVAAVLYGVGARLDREPELLFRLRQVDEKDLLARAGSATRLSGRAPRAERVLAADDLSALFGLDLGADEPGAGKPGAGKPAPRKPAPRKPGAGKPARRGQKARAEAPRPAAKRAATGRPRPPAKRRAAKKRPVA
jgi:uncharacterized Zn finger protein